MCRIERRRRYVTCINRGGCVGEGRHYERKKGERRSHVRKGGGRLQRGKEEGKQRKTGKREVERNPQVEGE